MNRFQLEMPPNHEIDDMNAQPRDKIGELTPVLISGILLTIVFNLINPLLGAGSAILILIILIYSIDKNFKYLKKRVDLISSKSM